MGVVRSSNEDMHVPFIHVGNRLLWIDDEPPFIVKHMVAVIYIARFMKQTDQ